MAYMYVMCTQQSFHHSCRLLVRFGHRRSRHESGFLTLFLVELGIALQLLLWETQEKNNEYCQGKCNKNAKEQPLNRLDDGEEKKEEKAFTTLSTEKQ